jgi:hypothetical protein|tara:strand:+ start:2223 stop:2504 length:282 start_codon:yes stop_codon:yes gene_type:complete
MKLRLKTSRIVPHLQKKDKRLRVVPKEAYDVFKEATPVRSGNARRKTRLQGTTIKADYPYAQRLDDGWSRQAPQGMVDPTIKFIKSKIAEILG